MVRCTGSTLWHWFQDSPRRLHQVLLTWHTAAAKTTAPLGLQNFACSQFSHIQLYLGNPIPDCVTVCVFHPDSKLFLHRSIPNKAASLAKVIVPFLKPRSFYLGQEGFCPCPYCSDYTRLFQDPIPLIVQQHSSNFLHKQIDDYIMHDLLFFCKKTLMFLGLVSPPLLQKVLS